MMITIVEVIMAHDHTTDLQAEQYTEPTHTLHPELGKAAHGVINHLRLNKMCAARCNDQLQLKVQEATHLVQATQIKPVVVQVVTAVLHHEAEVEALVNNNHSTL